MLSTKGKIRLALFIVGFLSLATSFISLIYMNSMMRRIENITLQDAALAALGRDISIEMLDARREEKNFIIYLDSAYIKNARGIIEQVKVNIRDAKNLSPESSTELDSMDLLINAYDEDITSLVAIFQEDPKALTAIQKQVLNYETELKKTVRKGKVQEDSLPSWISDLNVLMASAATKLSTERARLLTDLREKSDLLLTIAQRITARAQKSLAEHGEEGVRYGVLAQRNALTIFIITGILLIYFFFYFPHKILLPFKRMTKALNVIGSGDNAFSLPEIQKGDEFSELSQSFRDALYKLRYFNELKTDKIITIKKQFMHTLEGIKEAVVTLSSDLKITYINSAAKQLFSLDEAIVNKNVEDVSVLWQIFGEEVRAIEDKQKVTLSKRIKKTDLKKRTICIIPVVNSNNDIETFVVIVQ